MSLSEAASEFDVLHGREFTKGGRKSKSLGSAPGEFEIAGDDTLLGTPFIFNNSNVDGSDFRIIKSRYAEAKCGEPLKRHPRAVASTRNAPTPCRRTGAPSSGAARPKRRSRRAGARRSVQVQGRPARK